MERRRRELEREQESLLAERRQQQQGGLPSRVQELLVLQVGAHTAITLGTAAVFFSWHDADGQAWDRGCPLPLIRRLPFPTPSIPRVLSQVGEVRHASLVEGRPGGRASWQPAVANIR